MSTGDQYLKVPADASQYFSAAAALLQRATGCELEIANLIVDYIAQGAVRSDKPGEQIRRNAELFKAWSAGFEEGRKELSEVSK